VAANDLIAEWRGRPIDATDVVGRRIGAALIDFLVVAVLLVVIGVAFGRGKAHSGEVSVTLKGTSLIVFLVALVAYYFGGELATGQTLGKRLLGLRVQLVSGGAPAAGAIATRTLMRVV
jgi:uncharacterized RDD family membrane protein YckC